MSVLIETSLGDLVVDVDYKESPSASVNFLKLCALNYYDNCHFFRVSAEFIAQSGDPTNSGNSGDSIYAQCRPSLPFPDCPRRPHKQRGTISLVSGMSRPGSQFLVTLRENLRSLDAAHAAFGHVAEGLETLSAIERAHVDNAERPLRAIRIWRTVILADPTPSPRGLPATLPEVPGRGELHGALLSDDDTGPTDAPEREEKEAVREARSRAEVLEMIGDLPTADVAPPKNVLFVCKLNPVTEGEDLEIIFSRFGECKADIVKDRISGNSLGYAFVQFETAAQCENAYFKMDNALIDDRRIRVDFSQSVATLWNDVRRGNAQSFTGAGIRRHGR